MPICFPELRQKYNAKNNNNKKTIRWIKCWCWNYYSYKTKAFLKGRYVKCCCSEEPLFLRIGCLKNVAVWLTVWKLSRRMIGCLKIETSVWLVVWKNIFPTWSDWSKCKKNALGDHTCCLLIGNVLNQILVHSNFSILALFVLELLMREQKFKCHMIAEVQSKINIPYSSY